MTLLDALIPLPAFEPPITTLTPTPLPPGEGQGMTTFGGETVISITPPAPSTVTSGGTQAEEKPVTSQMTSKEPVTSSFPVPSSAILWGAGALAQVAGMSAYYLAKRREEEEAKTKALQSQASAIRRRAGWEWRFRLAYSGIHVVSASIHLYPASINLACCHLTPFGNLRAGADT